MHELLTAAALVAVAPLAVGARVGRADDVRTLDLPRPSWLTDDLQAKIVAAGRQGLEIPLPEAGPARPSIPTASAPRRRTGPSGVSVIAVSAGTCMVSPARCTMNFVFIDGMSS
jgi:hypothetical protein